MRLPTTIAALAGTAAILAAATGCTKTAGSPVAETAAETSASSASAKPDAPTSDAPTGDPVGTAVMAVRGGDAPVTIRYRINGGPEQTESNVSLPWEKSYPVHAKVESTLTADGGDTELICTITLDGDKVVSFMAQPRPRCGYAYWG